MTQPCKIGFAGTDARTLLSALTVSTARSQTGTNFYKGVVIRGTSAMPRFADKAVMDWDVDFIPTKDNSVEAFTDAIAAAVERRQLDYVVPMPEALLFNGLVNRLEEIGMGDRVAGLSREGAFIEGDKIKCKEMCRDAGIPVADAWSVVDANSFPEVLKVCLDYLHRFGGAVLKYPYSAGGKGARVVLNSWEIRQVYEELMADYKKSYKVAFKKRAWPLLIESRMSGMEISFTILVDGKGDYQVLPTAMDYPERFPGAAGSSNPITGGMGSISPHPFESLELIAMVKKKIVRPLIAFLKESDLLRPAILYPGCFASFDSDERGRMTPRDIRVCEINIRPGEPEFQAVMRRIQNPGRLFGAMFTGNLATVEPEVRDNQISLCTALVTGPGGPDGQKGYPWRVTKNEPLDIDFSYIRKKKIQIIPAAMAYTEEKGLVSDGTRVAYINLNGSVKKGQPMGAAAEKLINKTRNAFSAGKVRVIPREDNLGNRLAFREDIGVHFSMADKIQFTE